jgi:hypothetical protein
MMDFYTECFISKHKPCEINEGYRQSGISYGMVYKVFDAEIQTVEFWSYYYAGNVVN